VIAHRGLLPKLAELDPEQFRDEMNRALRAYLVDGAPPEDGVLALLAELDAWAPEEGIDEATAESYLWRMREREVRTLLRQAELERVPQLTETLAQIRDTIANLGGIRPTAPD
jgi:hypothetical protein